MSRFSRSSRARVRVGQAIYRVEQNASKNKCKVVQVLRARQQPIETILKNICTFVVFISSKGFDKVFPIFCFLPMKDSRCKTSVIRTLGIIVEL